MSADDSIRPISCNNRDDIDDHQIFKRKGKSSNQSLSQPTCTKSPFPIYEATEPTQCNQNGVSADSLTGKKPNDEVGTSDESDDDKPLSLKLKQPSAAINNTVSDDEKPLGSKFKRANAAVKKEVSDDSGDELPLGVRFTKKSKSGGTTMPSSTHSMKKEATILDSTVDSEDERSLLSKLKFNGTNSKKRSHREINISCNNGDDIEDSLIFKKKRKSSNQSLSQPICAKSPLPTYEATEPTQCNQNGVSTDSLTVKKPNDEVKISGDSDDDKPLGLKFKKSSAVINNTVSDDSDDDKPLRLKFKQSSAVINNTVSDDSDDDKPSGLKFKQSSAAINNTVSDDSDDDKPLGLKFKQPSAAINNTVSDDSDDEKPLGSKFKRAFAAVKKVVSDESGDELPLSVRFTKKKKSSGTPMPSSTHSIKKEATILDSTVDSQYEKHLLSELKFNGSNSKKRSHREINISTISPSKKAKIMDKSSVKQRVKTNGDDSDDDNVTIGQKMKKAVSLSSKASSKKVTTNPISSVLKKKIKKLKTTSKNSKFSKSSKVSPETGSEKKWTTFEHNGVMFPPPYKPHGIKMLYNGLPVDLTPEQEEVATMFAVMKDTDYASKPTFIENFMNDWRQILGKKHIIKKFELCDFTPIYEWHLKEKEKKKLITTEEKKALKEEKLKQEEKYAWAIVDGVKEKVGNFRVEPPGLFRGRGEHPKMGKLKRRIHPNDITINIGKDAPIPQCPIPGERWKEVRHDNTVTWLAFWTDPINNREGKYVYLAASSSLKGQSDKEKYEKARLLKDYIEDIRATYTRDFNTKDPTKRQIAVATYLIDKLALRAGNEKDDDEADTVGCCTLKVENVECIPNSNKLQFDFLGKDSIRYFNTVEVEIPVYKAIKEFRSAKKSDGNKKSGGDDIFDLLDTNKLNAHLRGLMPGLTAKVFRTYNASITLDNMLYSETRDGTVPEKLATYQLANKEVAIICNHQRSVSKGHDTSMSRLDEKIDALKAQREEIQVDLDRAKKGKPPLQDKDGKTKRNLTPEVLESKLATFDARIKKLELDKNTREELKTVALGTSKVNYLDPRISVAWCKRNEVPIEKVFNKSLLAKFAWSMDVDPGFRF